MLKKIIFLVTITLSQGCLSTLNCGTISGAINKENVASSTRTFEVTKGIILSPIFLACDIILSPLEIIYYSETIHVHSFTWNFETFWQDGYNSVPQREKQ